MQGAPQGRMPAFRQIAHTSSRTGAHTRQGVQGSWSIGSLQCEAGRHEHRGRGKRRKSHGSCSFGSPSPSRSPTGSRHHFALLFDCFWLASSGCGCGGRRRVQKSSWRRKKGSTPSFFRVTGVVWVVVALETGGRWSPEAVEFVEQLAAARARDAPPSLQRSSFLSWRRKVFCMFSGGTDQVAIRSRGHRRMCA